ncbi:P-loop NTPase fold protein [Mesonia sp. K4-1]|uniref:KAP family P-loop NTPase fold protein n=1 Tax=Mesonia sp. K4-1 TaxID=2602760 RepID=UPI0011C82175|nr:P-loop NTPase fold protein [Mesonia sp. K4-1]TXK74878.1 hypothetical protein FT986_10245 [Mesonia sp. K4-1]
MTKILDRIFRSPFTKFIISITIFILVVWTLKDWFNEKITANLTVDITSFDNLTFWLSGGLALVGFLFIFYKIILKLYNPSSFLMRLLGFTVVVYLLLRFTSYRNGWFFIDFGDTGLKYVDLLGLLLVWFFIGFLDGLLWRKYGIPKINYEITPFTADDPILNLEDDQLGYKDRAKSIIELLSQSNFKKSFTIGIVGPWGNGKSSLIELMERQIEEEPLQQTLHLKFLPYLNHSESEIISEFFTQLSGEISNYNGELADFIVEYSDKLLKLYKNKNIKEFFARRVSREYSENTSIGTYRKINRVLEKLNKRFIVFIDDLDRLSSKEVLQVLKLVRNTANFRNFIFVIALDKDYVLNTLVSNNDISDHTFVDKFFQLEVYLPEIDKLQLKEDFITQLENSGLQGKTEFIESVSKSIYQTNNLFDDYISNHRGAKRLVNQLVFDYEMLPDELDTNDFLNFTYLKMSFPSAIKFLNNNWQEILPYNPDSKLRELEDSGDGSDDLDKDLFKLIHRTRLFSGNSRFNPKLNDYRITSELKKEETSLKSSTLSNHQNDLLGKTLIVLFGKENKNPKHTSIKFGNNLRKLLQQKITANDLTNLEFQSIINEGDSFESLRRAVDAGKVEDIIDRITFYSPENSDEIKNIISLLLYIFNDAETMGAHSIHVLQILSDFIKSVVSENNEDNKNENLWKFIKTEFLDEDYKSFKKLEFLTFLSENRIRLDFTEWGILEEDLKELSLVIYKSFLDEKNGQLWEITDYTFYHAYHKVSKFHNAENINPLVIDFWENNDIKILCAQMVENETWTIRMLKTSDHAATIFESKQKYKDFVFDKLRDVTDAGLIEYKKFLNLESFTKFYTYIRFDFLHFKEIKQKLEAIKTNNRLSRDEYVNIVEIYVQSFEEEIYKSTFTNVTVNKFPSLVSNNYYENDGEYFTKIRVTTTDIHNTVPNLLKHYRDTIQNSKDYTLNLKKKEILRDEETVLKVLSVQPNDYSE